MLESLFNKVADLAGVQACNFLNFIKRDSNTGDFL